MGYRVLNVKTRPVYNLNNVFLQLSHLDRNTGINALVPDKNKVWIGTTTGIILFRYSTEKLERFVQHSPRQSFSSRQ